MVTRKSLPTNLNPSGAGGNVFMISYDSPSLVVDESNNARFKRPSADKIRSMALSILDKGQEQDVLVRKSGSQFPVAFGYTRWQAIKLINTDPELKKQRPGGKELQMRCKIQQMSDDEAIARNIDENLERAELTEMDKAFGMRVCKDRLGWKTEAIAKKYRVSVPRVGQYLKVFELETKYQDMIHDGRLGIDSGLELLGVNATERDEVIGEAAKDADDKAAAGGGGGKGTRKGRINGATVTAKVRDKKIEQAEKSGQEPEGVKHRSLREIRQFLDGENCAENHPQVRNFVRKFRRFVDGKVTDRGLQNALYALLNFTVEDDDEYMLANQAEADAKASSKAAA